MSSVEAHPPNDEVGRDRNRRLRAVSDVPENRPSSMRIIGGPGYDRGAVEPVEMPDRTPEPVQPSPPAANERGLGVMRRGADESATVMRALARKYEWTEQRFIDEYARTAGQMDGAKAEAAPSDRQVRRWLWGEAKPRRWHARVLEQMFPGYTVEDLRQPFDPRDRKPIPEPRTSFGGRGRGALAAQYTSEHSGETPAQQPQAQPPRSAEAVARVRELMSWVGTEAPIKEHEIRNGVASPPVEQSIRKGYYSYGRGSGVEHDNGPAIDLDGPELQRSTSFWGNHDRRNVRSAEEIQDEIANHRYEVEQRNSYRRGNGVERAR
ncbi:hypothetical protein ACFQZZ_29690 [Nocardia sp. GCM10030253]|uniref:hypothetical protein n=1 Tax=Nocardia sp. GCM10030253 TaxID=3273404 RepID=UPI0036453DC2